MPFMGEKSGASRTRLTAGIRRTAVALTVLALPFATVTASLPATAAATGPATGPASSPSSGLVQAFDNVGITTTSGAAGGNYDGIGDSFSAAGLAADALNPGRRLLHDGLTITWPKVAPGQPDNVLADGQTIPVTGSGSTLGGIGAAAYGDASGTFTVGYADGTTSLATVTFGDWINSSA